MLRLGFTGTREGCTQQQREKLERLLPDLRNEGFTIAEHGGCHGADREFHYFVAGLWQIRIWPSNTAQDKWAQDEASRFGKIEVHSIFAPLIRNRRIAERDRLLAVPATDYEVLRSGTWATIRYARKLHRKVIIIRPDGAITEETNE